MDCNAFFLNADSLFDTSTNYFVGKNNDGVKIEGN